MRFAKVPPVLEWSQREARWRTEAETVKIGGK